MSSINDNPSICHRGDYTTYVDDIPIGSEGQSNEMTPMFSGRSIPIDPSNEQQFLLVSCGGSHC